MEVGLAHTRQLTAGRHERVLRRVDPWRISSLVGEVDGTCGPQPGGMTGTGSGSAVARRATAGRRRSAGIYGSIITAAILTAAGGALSTLGLAVAVVVTLLVYWIAEEYAELLGEEVEGGRLPDRGQIRAALATTWPMVSVSCGPLIALVLTRLAGASSPVAADIGLATAVVLLVYHAWAAGRVARLRGRQLALTTAAAALLGALMIILKTAVLVHLH